MNPPEKSKKQMHRDISDVVKKYLNGADKKLLAKSGIMTVLAGSILAADILFLAGTFTVVTFWSAILTGISGSATATQLTARNHKNTALQTYKAKPAIANTVKEMEKRLTAAFNIASSPRASAEQKEHLEKLAVEINQDLQTIAPTFKVISGGVNGFGVDRLELVASMELVGKGQMKIVTLSSIINDLSAAAAQKAEEEKAQKEEIERLRARLAELEKDPASDKTPKHKGNAP